MLFGNRFSRHAPYSTPFIPEDEDVGGGMAQPKPKVGIFAKGGIGRGIVGSIGDALMAQAGMQPLYAQAMEYQRGEPDRELEREYMRSKVEAARQPELVNVPGVGLVRKHAGGEYEVVEPGDPRTATQKDHEYYMSLSPEKRRLYLESRAPALSDWGVGQAGQRQAATSAAAAKYRAPAKGGGSPQYEYKMGPNGKLLRRRIG